MATYADKIRWWGDRICGKGRVASTFLNRGPVWIQPEMEAAVRALEQAYMLGGYPLPTSYTGSYSCRKIAGTGSWSLHSVPIAVDVDYPNNPVLSEPLERGFGTHPKLLVTEQIVDLGESIVNDQGVSIWKWLGWRTPKPDPMHWEIDVAPEACQPVKEEPVFPSLVEGIVQSWAEDPVKTETEFMRLASEGLIGGSVDYWLGLLDDPGNAEWVGFVGRTVLSSWHRPG